MVLSLVTPLGANFMKDFPSQNVINCDEIDAYAGPSLITHPLPSYTPILGAVTTDPVLGTGGYIRGFYYQIFDQIYTWGELRFGTAGNSPGSGTWTISLPFAASSALGPNVSLGNAPVIGDGVIYDDTGSAGRQPVSVHLRTSTEVMFGSRMGTGLGTRQITPTTPITWTINDGLSWFMRYKRS